ncbi:hypothetical protein GCM10010833_13720 [Blastomonas aquatica]|uniref:Uncharacterized protein n=1 Tax=Blastomonas aquatica TaxID=1510276 RepID=A0ABQ1J568_9SPHN|nr:hypothetical protein GCM10010833_13720 [Blastomonas aquatica]
MLGAGAITGGAGGVCASAIGAVTRARAAKPIDFVQNANAIRRMSLYGQGIRPRPVVPDHCRVCVIANRAYTQACRQSQANLGIFFVHMRMLSQQDGIDVT